MKHFILPLSICAFTTCLMLSWNASAGSVIELKKNKILIDLEEVEVEDGEKIYLVDEEGKKKAIVTILSTRDGQAVAELVKGKPQVGMSLLKATEKKKKKKKKPRPQDEDESENSEDSDSESSDSEDSGDDSEVSARIKKRTGFLGNYSMGTASVSSVTVRSNSYGALYFHDFGLMRSANLRMYLGFYQSSGSSSSTTTLNGAGALKFDLGNGRGLTPWIGGGFDFLYSMRGGSTPLYRFLAMGGLDIPLSRASHLPIEALYGIGLNGGGVNYSYIEVRFGYGWLLR